MVGASKYANYKLSIDMTPMFKLLLVCSAIVALASTAVTGVFGDNANSNAAHATYYGGASGNDGTMGGACGYGDMLRVSCIKQGGIRFHIMGNPYFQQVLVYNVGGSGDVASLAIKGHNTMWQKMWRNWGEVWQFSENLRGQALSFYVTTGDGGNSVSQDITPVSWEYGQTFDGSQFP